MVAINDPDEYQRMAARTLIDGPGFVLSDYDFMIVWNALALAGEAGEVAEMVKKGLLHQHGLNVDDLAKELGDVMWYVAALATKIGVPLSEIMGRNIDKLLQRYPDGYNTADSIKRVDVPPFYLRRYDQSERDE